MKRTINPVKAPHERVCGPIDYDDDEICGGCDGSGEGRVHGSRCVWCGGSGVKRVRDDDSDDGEDYYDSECELAAWEAEHGIY